MLTDAGVLSSGLALTRLAGNTKMARKRAYVSPQAGWKMKEDLAALGLLRLPGV